MHRKDVLNSSLQLCFSLQAVARDSKARNSRIGPGDQEPDRDLPADRSL